MRIRVLQHVPFEGPGIIADWASSRQHELEVVRLFAGEPLPAADELDFLVIMGGPMGVADIATYPWLHDEMELIQQLSKRQVPILGICLGAQLIACAVGAAVTRNGHREIGWFPVHIDEAVAQTRFSEIFPSTCEVLHWHGDTFDLPENAVRLGSSEACANQGFIIDDRIVALQFHLEVTADSLASLVEFCNDELDGSRYVQSATELLSDNERFEKINPIMFALLDRLSTHD